MNEFNAHVSESVMRQINQANPVFDWDSFETNGHGIDPNDEIDNMDNEGEELEF